jgi:N-acetylmuramoyl-L-alanine amidase
MAFQKMSLQEFEAWLIANKPKRRIGSIQQHHTYKPGYKEFTGSNHVQLQNAMKDHHVKNNGWADIGQHFTSFPDGSIMTGRSLEKIPACIKGQNTGAICIEHVGGFDSGQDQMTEAHKQTIVGMTAILCRVFGLAINTDTVVYHHWFHLQTGKRVNGGQGTKTCPGTNFFGGNTVSDCENKFLPLVRAGAYTPGTNIETPASSEPIVKTSAAATVKPKLAGGLMMAAVAAGMLLFKGKTSKKKGK